MATRNSVKHPVFPTRAEILRYYAGKMSYELYLAFRIPDIDDQLTVVLASGEGRLVENVRVYTCGTPRDFSGCDKNPNPNPNYGKAVGPYGFYDFDFPGKEEETLDDLLEWVFSENCIDGQTGLPVPESEVYVSLQAFQDIVKERETKKEIEMLDAYTEVYFYHLYAPYYHRFIWAKPPRHCLEDVMHEDLVQFQWLPQNEYVKKGVETMDWETFYRSVSSLSLITHHGPSTSSPFAKACIPGSDLYKRLERWLPLRRSFVCGILDELYKALTGRLWRSYTCEVNYDVVRAQLPHQLIRYHP